MADKIFDVMSRLGQLDVQSQQKGNNVASRKKVEMVHFADPNQHGSYLLIPLPNPIYGALPYVLLNGVKQYKVSKKYGENSYLVTKKILPTYAYDIFDPQTQRVISPLTNDDLALHKEVSKEWDDLYRKMGGYKKAAERTPEEQKMLRDKDKGVGSKNYTIFNGFVISRYDASMRNVIKSNYPALIVIPSAAMVQSVQNNILQISATNGGNQDWVNNIYNFDPNSRMGSIMLNVTRTTGYQITVTHNIAQQPIEIKMSEEDRALMENNPVENFIGSQYIRPEELTKAPGQRNLFNKEYYAEMLDELKRLNAAFDAGQGYAADYSAIAALKRDPVQGSADPFVNPAKVQPNVPVGNANQFTQAQPQQFAQPQSQAAHVDPILGQNVAANNGYNNPGFGQAQFSNPFANMNQAPQNPVQQGGDDLPF